MSTSKLVTCIKCGWVHFQVSRKFAEEGVKSFNNYFYSLPEEKREQYYHNKPATMKEYSNCFFCNGPYTNFRDFIEGDCPPGVTLQPIIDRDE
jgi:predicted  nucleic acid-binding Zn-ribbon protein